MTNLKEIHGMNEFCGPGVLSALTGRSTDECAAVISVITGRQVIKGVFRSELLQALKKLGYETKQVQGGRTLFGTLMRLQAMGDGMYTVHLPHHVVAVEVNEQRVYLIDNHTKQPLVASNSSRMMQQVEEVYKVIKRAEPKFLFETVELNQFANNRFDIWQVKNYENKEDNVRLQIGHIKFDSQATLATVAELLLNKAKDMK